MLKNIKYQYRLFINFSMVIAIILIISAAIFYFYTSTLVRNNIQETQRNVTQVIKEQIDRLLFDMDKVTKQALFSSSIMEILSSIEPSDENYFDLNPGANDKIKDVLFSYIASEKFNGRLSVVSRYGDYAGISNAINDINMGKQQIVSIQRINDQLTGDKYSVNFPPHQDEWQNNQRIVLTVNRPLRDSFRTYGVVEYSKSIEYIDNLCKAADTGKKYYTALLDDKGGVIYSNFDSGMNVDINKLYNPVISEKVTGMYSLNDKGNNFSLCFSRLDTANWTVVQLENLSEHYKPVIFLRNMIVTCYLLAFLTLMGLLLIFTYNLAKPIRQLKKAVLQVNEDGKMRFSNSATNNEVTVLANAIEEMLGEIKIKNNKMMQAREREIKAHFQAMEAQLNPHFLYNILTVIGAYGQSQSNKIVGRMCTELAKLLRYTVDYSNKYTTMKDEIENVKGYLYLMKMRYQDFIEYEFAVEEELLDIQVPKLILQPIVENCFKHGFENVEPVWKIKVSVFGKEGKWFVSVENNGREFSPEEIVQIFERFGRMKAVLENRDFPDDVKTEGLGLINTIMRLHIFYGGREHFTIETAEGMTKVEIGGMIDGKKI